jgi:hypothetical protein
MVMDEQRSTGNDHAHRTQVNEELRLLHSSCISEIASFKQQQWATTNYGLLAYAALVSLTQLKPQPSSFERYALVVVAAGVLVIGLYVIRKLDRSIETRRTRLNSVRSHFTPEFRAAHGGTKKNALTWFFSTAFTTGFVITAYLIMR